MDAKAHELLKVLGFNRQLFAPLYQRPYVWEKDKQWKPLWEDIRKIADKLLSGDNDPQPHFLGAVVLEQLKVSVDKPDARSMIDGQQRLTTLQILLTAIKDICNENPDYERYKKIAESLLFNQNVIKEEDRFKVWPTNIDRNMYQIIMNCNTLENARDKIATENLNVNSRIAQAYFYFYPTLKQWIYDNNGNASKKIKALLNTIQKKLRIVVIEMGSDDNAQVIFETLNARGTPLLPSDLVKNFLFHKAQEESKSIHQLYKKFWLPFEEEDDFWRQEVKQGRLYRPRIDQFLQHYLTLMLNEEVSVRTLFAEYQKFVDKNSRKTANWFFNSLSTYAAYYNYFQKNISRESRENTFFWRLHTIDISILYPFLLGLYHKLGNKDRNQEEKIGIFIDLESYLVRRIVCGLTAKNYNRIFLNLLTFLKKEGNFTQEALRAFLLKQKGDSGRWPNDEEFKNAWIDTPIYKRISRPRLRMILLALDDGLRTSKTEYYKLSADLTVEHLLPRGWEVYWPLAKKEGETADEKIERINQRNGIKHTIGNLTFLTQSLNPAISNGPFKSKRREILKHSVINLNRFLNEADSWDEVGIKARSRKLFTVIKKTWPYPNK